MSRPAAMFQQARPKGYIGVAADDAARGIELYYRGVGATIASVVSTPCFAGGREVRMGASSSDLESHFTPILSGKFMSRSGGAGPSAIRSEMKICFVATDKPFLIELLYELSLRKDCCSVKYSVFARDGMYLGRCFLTSEDAAGRLCAEYKSHHKLMVSIQDDEFFNDFR